MEKSRLIKSERPGGPNDRYYAFVSGDEVAGHSAPLRAAWAIEHAARAGGWREGHNIGSEAQLREWLGVGREALREAIRIVESRGAMRMRRGRGGGLIVALPDLDRAAAAFATYHRVTGCTAAQVRRSAVALDRMLLRFTAGKGLPDREPGLSLRMWLAHASGETMLQLCVRALELMAPGRADVEDAFGLEAMIRRYVDKPDDALLPALIEAMPRDPFDLDAVTEESGAGREATAMALATRMLEGARAAPDRALGNEARLCDSFLASRAMVRQALRILGDLDMIEVKRGRGGGYLIKEPSPIGIIRQLFPFMAGQQSSAIDLTMFMWELNSANLRAAGAQLAVLGANARVAALHDLEAVVAGTLEPERFILIQQALARLADGPMVDTLARCVVSYQARLMRPLPLEEPPPQMQADFAVREMAIVTGLRAGDVEAADRALRGIQDSMLDMLHLVYDR